MKILVNIWNLITNLDILPTNSCNRVTFNKDDSLCVFTSSASPYIYIYNTKTTPWSKVENPNKLPTGNSTGVSFSPTQNICAVGYSSSLSTFLGFGGGYDAGDSSGIFESNLIYSSASFNYPRLMYL